MALPLPSLAPTTPLSHPALVLSPWPAVLQPPSLAPLLSLLLSVALALRVLLVLVARLLAALVLLPGLLRAVLALLLVLPRVVPARLLRLPLVLLVRLATPPPLLLPPVLRALRAPLLVALPLRLVQLVSSTIHWF